MKRLVVVVFVMVLAAVCCADYASEVMADGPEAYYRFEESAGATSVADHSGNGHGSTAVSDVIFGETGAVGKAGTCSNGYVRLDLQLSPAADDFSIEAIARFDVSDIARTFVSQDDGAGDGRILLSRNPEGKVFTRLGGEFNSSSSAISQGTWHHIVMTVEDGGTTDTIRFYIDGQPDGSDTTTAEFANGNWKLGSGMIGALDEVAIYTKTLSAEKVLDHYTLIDPVSEYPGDSPVHYVSRTGLGVYPYTNWTTAARFIQQAVDAAQAGDTVLVTNGSYASAAEISVTKAITIESVNGRDVTFVSGQDAHRCFNLGNSACTISGFAIVGGYVDNDRGGGVYCVTTNPVITHCTLSFNKASGYDGEGGGIYKGTLNHCTLTYNQAGYGGGSDGGTLNHCTLTQNRAYLEGGGSHNGTLKNCIVWENSADQGLADNWYDDLGLDISYSCTTPDPDETGNNITNSPRFVSSIDLHLLSNSPCIDAGTNLVGFVDDLDGTPRPLDGDANGSAIPDMGAYEYLNAVADSDGDSVTDGDEQIADTGITDSNDWFSVTAFTSNSVVSFESSDERQYTLQYCTNLVDGVWSNIVGQADILGSGGLDTLTDPAPTNSPCYYRVQVSIP